MKRAKQLARSLILLAFAAALAARTQQQQPPGFTEKVEVNVRTVLAVVTDAKGKPIERPLVGPGRIRVTLAVEAKGSKPFVHHNEMDLTREDTGTTWLYDALFEWPPEAERVAVTVEELKTGARGTAVAELPSPATGTGSLTALPGMFSSARAGPELPLEITFRDVKRSARDHCGPPEREDRHRAHLRSAVEEGARARPGHRHVGVPCGRTQLVNLERSVLFDITVDNWTIEIPVTCSVNATRLIVTIAELESGGHAVASFEPAKLE